MFLKRVISSITTVALCASFMVPAVTFADAAFTGGTDISGGLNVQVSITDLQVTGAAPGDTIPVFLYVPAGSLSMTTTTGLTFTGSSSGQRLYFSGTLTDINTALATLKYTHSSAGTYTLEASIIGSGQIYDPSTQHMYEVVNNGSSITATAARSAATARSINGVSGYLANITSSDENSFVAARITQDGWFGASDAGIEGDWVWLDGPESGTLFWRGTAGGTSFGYENWAGSEPNQSGDEDCSEFYANGSGWNDLPCSHAGISTYIVEYGAPGNLPNVASDTLDITLSADTTTQAPTLTSPTSNSTQNTLQLSYSLPEVPAASTVSVSFNDDTTTTTLTMSDSQSVNTTVNLASLISTSGVASTTAASLADGTYTVTLSYQDYLGNPASTDVATAVTIDTIAPNAPVITAPSTNRLITAAENIIAGTCETGATVSIDADEIIDTPATGVCTSGAFSITISFSPDAINTSFTLNVTQTDPAGNESDVTAKEISYKKMGGGGKNLGCGDPKALNYNENKTHSSELCIYPEIAEPKTEEATTEKVQGEGNPNANSEKEISSEKVPSLNSAPEGICVADEYLKNPIKLGANNNPEDVKLLEKFLNKYENANLPVDGIYSREDFDAVIKWQEKHADDILKPWGISKGTGYVYTKSLAKIKEIVSKDCPMKDETNADNTEVVIKEEENN